MAQRLLSDATGADDLHAQRGHTSGADHRPHRSGAARQAQGAPADRADDRRFHRCRSQDRTGDGSCGHPVHAGRRALGGSGPLAVARRGTSLSIVRIRPSAREVGSLGGPPNCRSVNPAVGRSRNDHLSSVKDITERLRAPLSRHVPDCLRPAILQSRELRQDAPERGAVLPADDCVGRPDVGRLREHRCATAPPRRRTAGVVTLRRRRRAGRRGRPLGRRSGPRGGGRRPRWRR